MTAIALRLGTVIRFVSVLCGLFLAASTIADIAGLIPHSDEMPPLGARVLSSLPALLFGIVLLMPHRWFLASPRVYVLLAAHLLIGGVTIYGTAQALVLVRSGDLDPAAVAVAALAAGIPLLNAAVLWLRWRSLSPSSSFRSFRLTPTDP